MIAIKDVLNDILNEEAGIKRCIEIILDNSRVILIIQVVTF